MCNKGKNNESFFICVFLMILFFFTAAFASAETISLSNADFESGPDAGTATSWSEQSGIDPNMVYFLPSQGEYNEPGYIVHRAATFKSNGAGYLQQALSGVQAKTYDKYSIEFYMGYRNDITTSGDVYPFRVSIWDVNSNKELAGEDMYAASPGPDANQSPNVGLLMQRKVILWVPPSPSTNEVALRFTNKCIKASPGYASPVVDNVAISGYRTVARWKFENDFNDFYFGEHNGTGYNSPTFDSCGVDGSALSVNGTNAVVVPYSASLCPNSFTVSAWAKLSSSSTTGTQRSVVSNRNTPSPRSGYIIYADENEKWTFATGYTSGWDTLAGDTIVKDEWAHLVITFSAESSSGYDLIGTKRLYINGQLAAQKSNAYYRPITNKVFLIGAGRNENASYGYFFKGQIDDVQVYNCVLTKAEVANLYLTHLNTFKVMTYNIHKGVGTDSEPNLARIADVIKQCRADIVGLQEVDINSTNQAEWLADELGMYYYFGPAAFNNTYGNALLSKYPILSANNYALPQYQSEQTRACIVAKVDVNGKICTCLVTHFDDNYNEAKILQADYITNTVNYDVKGEKILMGDLNARSYYEATEHMKHSFRDTFDIADFNGVNPYERIDYVMLSHNFNGHVYNIAVVDNALTQVASDHKPVVADIKWY